MADTIGGGKELKSGDTLLYRVNTDIVGETITDIIESAQYRHRREVKDQHRRWSSSEVTDRLWKESLTEKFITDTDETKKKSHEFVKG